MYYNVLVNYIFRYDSSHNKTVTSYLCSQVTENVDLVQGVTFNT